MRGFCPYERSKHCFKMRLLLWWTNLYTLICFCLLLLVSLRLAFTSCVTAPFLLGLFWGLPRSHRLSSHSVLNALVIQTKITLPRRVGSKFGLKFGFRHEFYKFDICPQIWTSLDSNLGANLQVWAQVRILQVWTAVHRFGHKFGGTHRFCMSRMKDMLFHCTHFQMVSLRRKYTFLFPQARFQDVSACLHLETPCFPSRLCLFLCKPCTFAMNPRGVSITNTNSGADLAAIAAAIIHG